MSKQSASQRSSDPAAAGPRAPRPERPWRALVRGVARRDRFPLALVLLALALFLAAKAMSCLDVAHVPAMHLSRTGCRLTRAALAAAPGPPLLVLAVYCESRGWERDYDRLLTLSTEDGALLGQQARRGVFRWIGLTPQEAWIARGQQAEGFALPDLRRRHALSQLLEEHPELEGILERVSVDGLGGRLRLAARNGREYRLTVATKRLEQLPLDPPAPAPTLLSGWPDCAWTAAGRVYEHRGCEPMAIDGDAMTVAIVRRDGREQLTIARRRADGGARWQRTARELFGSDEPLRLQFATLHAGRIYLAATEREQDDVYVAAVTARDGVTVWSRTFW